MNYKKIYLILSLSIIAVSAWGQSVPKWVKKAQKSVVSVLTYGEDGNLMKSGTGFYCGDKGMAVADYS